MVHNLQVGQKDDHDIFDGEFVTQHDSADLSMTTGLLQSWTVLEV